MHHHAVEIGVDLIYTYLVRHTAKVQSDVSEAVAVISNKAFAALFQRGFLNKFTLRKSKTRYTFFSL